MCISEPTITIRLMVTYYLLIATFKPPGSVYPWSKTSKAVEFPAHYDLEDPLEPLEKQFGSCTVHKLRKKTKKWNQKWGSTKNQKRHHFVLKLNTKLASATANLKPKTVVKKRFQKSTKFLFFHSARTLPTIPVAVRAGRPGNIRNVNHQFFHNTMSHFFFCHLLMKMSIHCHEHVKTDISTCTQKHYSQRHGPPKNSCKTIHVETLKPLATSNPNKGKLWKRIAPKNPQQPNILWDHL